jgi:hypothetical protein
MAIFTPFPSLCGSSVDFSSISDDPIPRMDKMRYVVLVRVTLYRWPFLLSLQEVSGDGSGVEAFSGDVYGGFFFSLL